MLHPLLKKLDILNENNIDNFCKNIEDLGLLVKKHDNLLIVKYPDNLKFSSEDYITKSRGIIIDFNQKKIVNTSISGGISLDQFKEKVTNWDDIVIEKCLDGILVNLYYYNNKWNLSTKFNINADESRFRSQKTFRELFDEIINIERLKLDTSFSYSFLLRHKDSRNITPIKRNRLIHIESTNNTTGEKVKIDLGLKTPKLIKLGNLINKHNFSNYDDIISYLENKNWKFPGFMLYSRDRRYRTKIENKNFNNVRDLVKNQANIDYILLEHLNKKDIQLLLKYFPEWQSRAIEINKIVYDYIEKAYEFYIKNKVDKSLPILDKKYKKIIYNLHGKYVEMKKSNSRYKIEYTDVCKLVREYDTAYLYNTLIKNVD